MKLIEESAGWRLSFSSGTLQMIKIDFRLGLLLRDGAETAEVTVETPFGLTGPGVNVSCSPEIPESLAPVLMLVNKEVTEIAIQSSGHMTLSFKSGSIISVGPNDSYEAWQISGSVGFLLVCQPEGRISFFK
jgi:Family of unknown function (DUF6188)